MKFRLVTTISLFILYGCSVVGETIPDDAIPLTTEEIVTAFSGVSESYSGRDNTEVTATATFTRSGEYEASWSAGNQKGEAIGEWYAENGKRCLKENKADSGSTNIECRAIYKTGDVYTSVNDDGSVHGIHTLTPLE